MKMQTPLEIAVMLAIIYFSWKIAKEVMPFMQRNQDEKIDLVLTAIEKSNEKLDEIESKLNSQTADIRVHDVEIEHLKARIKKVEDNNAKKNY